MTFDVSRVRAILFDLDGTLADTDDEYVREAARWVRPVQFLFPRRDPTPFLRWAVMTAEAPVNTLMALPDWLGIDDELVKLMNWLSDRRGSARIGHYMIMAGVKTLLERLSQRYPMAVITARPERGARVMLEQLGLSRFFQLTVSAQTAPHTKPYPDPVHWAARALSTPVKDCVMIGDTTVDILAGRRAGAQTIGVLCGFGQHAELERVGADLILNHTADLSQILST